MLNRSVEILLVEDSAADAELTRQGLLEAELNCNLNVVDHGGKAISFLHREGQFTEAPRPELILLDLDLPQLDGFAVLKHIRAQPTLKDIPVVVLTSHVESEKIRETYKLQANACMSKPVNFEQFVSLVKEICAYWFEMVQLPESELGMVTAPPTHNKTWGR